jgi:tRNA(Ile)-lysidine synthase
MKIFINHIEKFIERAGLLYPSKKVVVAVSAGSDSMALLFVMGKLLEQGGISSLRAFHVNHGTRPENELEQKLVEKVCSQLNISLTTFRINLNPQSANFEFMAREKRYELFFAKLEKDEVLLTAHHLDDSFEWSLLRQMKSGNQKAFLGIPVKNGVIRRPFLCVSKSQIRKFVSKYQIPFMEDSSNKLIRFERNYLREKVIIHLTKRFSNHLKHYVFRSNELANRMNLSVFTRTCKKFEIKKDKFNGYLLISNSGDNDFNGAQEYIQKVIYLLSNKKRGTLSSQIEKLIKAASAQKKGPLVFSGGVLCFIGPNHLYFIAKESIALYDEMDQKILERLKNKEISFTSKNVEQLKKEIYLFPQLVFAPKMPRNFPSIKTPHPLLPKSSNWAIDNNIWCNTLSKLVFQFERASAVERNSNFPLYLTRP